MKTKSEKYKRAINISCTFLNRCICKYCGTRAIGAGIYYKPIEYSLPVHYSIIFQQALKRSAVDRGVLSSKFSLREYKAGAFAYTSIYCSVPVSVNKTRGCATFDNNFSEFLYCRCGKTWWYFDQVSVANKKEVVNRKGKYSYPKKFA